MATDRHLSEYPKKSKTRRRGTIQELPKLIHVLNQTFQLREVAFTVKDPRLCDGLGKKLSACIEWVVPRDGDCYQVGKPFQFGGFTR
jgi:hypothetical protein